MRSTWRRYECSASCCAECGIWSHSTSNAEISLGFIWWHHEEQEKAMAKGYWIVRVDITDQEKYKSYIGQCRAPQEIWRPLLGARRPLRESRGDKPRPQCGDRVSYLSGGHRLLEVARIPASSQVSAACVDHRSRHHRGVRRAAADLTAMRHQLGERRRCPPTGCCVRPSGRARRLSVRPSTPIWYR
jgi:hypothetical protein